MRINYYEHKFWNPMQIWNQEKKGHYFVSKLNSLFICITQVIYGLELLNIDLIISKC